MPPSGPGDALGRPAATGRAGAGDGDPAPLFLLDEPFSGLDAPLRAATRAELVDLHRKLGATMILVTHDQAEALAIGDRVAMLDRGRVVQVGRPMDLYDRPPPGSSPASSASRR